MPVLSHAGTHHPDRSAASAKHKKAKGKKAKKGKVKKAKAAHKAKAKSKKASHAPTHEMGEGVNHTPPEMKEDLPAPSVESTTEQ